MNMGKLILCETKPANSPYIFDNTKVEVFSYEELCFYIYNNVSIISGDHVSLRLISWIKKELNMDKLADELMRLKAKDAELIDMLVEVLTAANYYTIDEIKAFIKKFEVLRMMSKPERDKQKGDCFLMYKRYIKAYDIYEELLQDKDNINDEKLLGDVYHNRGIALANNMEIAKAKSSFLNAYNYNGNQESLKAYFVVLASEGDEAVIKKNMDRFEMPDEFYDTLLDEISDAKEDLKGTTVYARLERALYNKRQGNIADYDRRMDNILKGLKDEFREQTI